MNTAYFLINTIFDLYLMVVLLRVWLQWARADFYNPMSQMVVKVTNPLVIPLRRIIPGFGGLDMASVLLALIIAFAKLALLKSMNVLLTDWLTLSLFAVLTILKKTGSMIFWVLLIRAILSWVSQGRNPIEYVMHQLTEPFLAPIRRIVPQIGGVDLSVLVLIILLHVAALYGLAKAFAPNATASVERAVATEGGDAEAIVDRNLATLRQLGLAGWQALWSKT